MNNDIIDWDKIGISNDFMFGKIMINPELCKGVLERILNIEIDHIEYPELQKEIDMTRDARSVRLDVYLRDGKGTVYNIEMQASNTKELPKRSRYYQGILDLNLIEKGEHYRNLSKSFVIFICTFDVFGKGRHIYTFENICKEEKGLELGDETVKIFLNSDSIMNDVSKELKAFLDFVGGKKSEDDFVKKLEKEIIKVKENKEWRRDYMTLLMRDRENLEKGIEQGIEQGIKQGMEKGMKQGEKMLSELIKRLVEDSRSSDIIKVTQDETYRQLLYKEYKIID